MQREGLIFLTLYRFAFKCLLYLYAVIFGSIIKFPLLQLVPTFALIVGFYAVRSAVHQLCVVYDLTPEKNKNKQTNTTKNFLIFFLMNLFIK